MLVYHVCIYTSRAIVQENIDELTNSGLRVELQRRDASSHWHCPHLQPSAAAIDSVMSGHHAG
jgi:hypothetical protein